MPLNENLRTHERFNNIESKDYTYSPSLFSVLEKKEDLRDQFNMLCRGEKVGIGYFWPTIQFRLKNNIFNLITLNNKFLSTALALLKMHNTSAHTHTLIYEVNYSIELSI